MKRKTIVFLSLLIFSVVSTIAVRAERPSNPFGSHIGSQGRFSGLPHRSRIVSSSLISSFLSTREEGSYLVLEGGVFFLVGFFLLKRARRDHRAMLVGPND